VDGVTFEDLPTSIRSRLVAAEGEQLSVITPAQDIAPVDKLSAFISGVRSLEPHATGRPVIEWGVGNIVVRAFQEALAFAIIGITIVLSFAMRRVASVLMILVPLVLAALLTLSLGVVFDMPINMANILVIPLIFGLGVDNGIHVVDRYLGEGDVDHLMHSSTPRAVLLSTMTTIGAFAALSLSPHAGTASIGIVLTVAVGLLLVITVFLLPVLLSVSRRPA
jgi:predicted RND superfamily exporter protein